jgi:hypothetical protein
MAKPFSLIYYTQMRHLVSHSRSHGPFVSRVTFLGSSAGFLHKPATPGPSV